MDTETTSTIALISLILVIAVIIYLIVGRIIKYRWPDSKANRFFGGVGENEYKTVLNGLLAIENEPDVRNGLLAIENDPGVKNDLLNKIHAFLDLFDINNNIAYNEAVMAAIRTIIADPMVSNDYKSLVVIAYKDRGIINEAEERQLNRSIASARNDNEQGRRSLPSAANRDPNINQGNMGVLPGRGSNIPQPQ